MQATYTQDNLGRLTQIVFDSGTQVNYYYDAVGNRTSVVRVGPPMIGDPSDCQLRITLTQADPWGLTDVTGGATLYIEPIYDKVIGVWGGTTTSELKVSPFSISLAGLTAQNYRLYVYDSNDDAVVDAGFLVPWTNSTTPPSDTLVADGYLVNASRTNCRAVADILVHATGQCDWRNARRGVCHIDERSRRVARLTAFPSDDSWVCLRNQTWRAINGGTVIGEHFVEFILSNNSFVSADASAPIDGVGVYRYDFGFGMDSTTANSATQSLGNEQAVGGNPTTVHARLRANTGAGKHALTIIEQNLTTNRDVTVYGDDALSPPVFKTGMLVEVML